MNAVKGVIFFDSKLSMERAKSDFWTICSFWATQCLVWQYLRESCSKPWFNPSLKQLLSVQFLNSWITRRGVLFGQLALYNRLLFLLFTFGDSDIWKIGCTRLCPNFAERIRRVTSTMLTVDIERLGIYNIADEWIAEFIRRNSRQFNHLQHVI